MTETALAEFVRRNDPDRFLASVFAPADRRAAVWGLCAFNHELARAREVVREPMLALIRLQWWREVVQGVRRRHEVAGPLGALLDLGVVEPEDLEAMIAAREVEADAGMPDLAAWSAHKLGTGGGLAVAAGLARQGRCGLPEDRLGVHGLTGDHVLRDPACAAPVLDELAAVATGWMQAGGGRFSAGVIAAGLPVVLARRDLSRGARHRGVWDRLAVVRSGVLGRI